MVVTLSFEACPSIIDPDRLAAAGIKAESRGHVDGWRIWLLTHDPTPDEVPLGTTETATVVGVALTRDRDAVQEPPTLEQAAGVNALRKRIQELLIQELLASGVTGPDLKLREIAFVPDESKRLNATTPALCRLDAVTAFPHVAEAGESFLAYRGSAYPEGPLLGLTGDGLRAAFDYRSEANGADGTETAFGVLLTRYPVTAVPEGPADELSFTLATDTEDGEPATQ